MSVEREPTAEQRAPGDLAWWQRGVIYQIWVRSFFDTDGNGNGDLNGVAAKLEYLQWLGVDVLWLSPIYPSPLIESGYDISDYTGVHGLFGTLEDFDRLLAEAHARGMRVILDFVPSHTSDAHPWFVESRSSRDNPKRDWYLWADPKADGSPPTNWVGCFGGSAWTYDKETGQFYYHAFLPQQPDLNWRHPEVRRAVYDAMRFWLARGVDGFRVDAVWHMIKDARLRDNPPNPDYTPDLPPDNLLLPEFTRDRPEMAPLVAEMRRVVDEFPERMLGGELYLGVERMMAYYGTPAEPQLHMPFNLQLSVLDWSAEAVGEWMEQYLGAMPPHGWPNWAVSTHDSRRIAHRAGYGQARVAATLLLTARGTPTIYYGDEIGMPGAEVPRDQITDLRELLAPYLGLGRDPARTPMQWDAQPGAGFSHGAPWLPVADDFSVNNVNQQSDDPCSTLSLHRRLLALRRELPALAAGAHQILFRDDACLVYERSHGEQRLVVALNLTGEPRSLRLDGLAGALLLSSRLDREGDPVHGLIELRGDEAVIVRLDP
ncbi:MAG TPA: alpha-amylase family glycosyl hydrolase [Chloroflexaceae bacterium]|nr:alpha-amylase family glycosyl hydrolase [Chloroflexaceae bacterium]